MAVVLVLFFFVPLQPLCVQRAPEGQARVVVQCPDGLQVSWLDRRRDLRHRVCARMLCCACVFSAIQSNKKYFFKKLPTDRYKAQRWGETERDSPFYALKGMKGTVFSANDGIPIAAIREIAVFDQKNIYMISLS